MLGIFGNVPAFDGLFRKGFDLHSFGRKALRSIGNYYAENKTQIDAIEIYTFDYETGEPTQRRYTKAKIVDMIGFIEGTNMRSNFAPVEPAG